MTKKPKPETEFITLKEAAQRVGVGYRTMLRLVLKGDIPAYRPTKSYIIKPEDLDTFINSRKVNPDTRLPHQAQPAANVLPGQMPLFQGTALESTPGR